MRNLLISLVDGIAATMMSEAGSESHRDMEVAKRINNYCVNMFGKFDTWTQQELTEHNH